MPRVHTRKKSTRGTKTYRCTGCGNNIESGEEFYYWTRRFGRSGVTYYKHVKCGRPRRTELSSSKTAVIEEAVEDAQNAISEWTFEIPPEVTFETAGEGDTVTVEYDDLLLLLEDVKTQAEEVADEYEAGRDNMPEGLQQGTVGEAMGEVADELRNWAERLTDDLEGSENAADVPDPADYEDEDKWREALQQSIDDVIDQLREAAASELDDMPEYQG